MARTKKEDEKAILPKKRYIAKYENFSFDVQAVDENGKPKVRMTNTGNPMYDKDGNTIPIHITKKFTYVGKVMKGGFVTGNISEFIFDPNDTSPQNVIIGKRLEQLDADRGVEMEVEDKYEMNANPQAWEAKKKAKDAEKELSELKEAMNDPEALSKRLEELTRPQ